MLIWVPINVNLYNNVFSVLFCQFPFSLSWISESPMTVKMIRYQKVFAKDVSLKYSYFDTTTKYQTISK